MLLKDIKNLICEITYNCRYATIKQDYRAIG